MPLLLVIFGLAFGAYALGARRAARAELAARAVKVGAVVNPERPPASYKGDLVFSLPQRRWGRVECLACAPSGCRYGVRFPNGNAVVLGDHELVR